jgi:sulfide:quinone oxidoreductase
MVRAGLKSVICNRRDGESADQFNQCDLADAADKAGLTLAYLPVVSGRVTPENGQAFAAMQNELPAPTPVSI